MIKRYLKIYPSVHFAKHTCLCPVIKENTTILKKDLVFNPVKSKQIYLNNKLKKKNSVNEIKRVYYFKLWNALTQYDFTLFENTIQQFLNEGYKYDEVIYTLLVHSYILNHKKKNENAYLIIEEMKRAYMHPTIIKINERMINSFIELEMLFCEPSKNLWINICRCIWEVSIKLNRERKRKLREQLALLHPNDVLKLTKEDLKAFLKKEYEEALLNTIETVHVDSDLPYDHMLIENVTGKKEGELEILPNDHKHIENEYKKLDINNIKMNKEENGELCLYNDSENLVEKEEMDFLNQIKSVISSSKVKTEQNNIEKNDALYETINYTDEHIEDLGCINPEPGIEQEDDILFDEEEDFDIQLLKKYFKYK